MVNKIIVSQISSSRIILLNSISIKKVNKDHIFRCTFIKNIEVSNITDNSPNKS